MKAKLVQYPFNEKKFEWDTQKQTREFEYTWEQSVPRNFSTITPYIKTAPFNASEAYDDYYGVLTTYQDAPTLPSVDLYDVVVQRKTDPISTNYPPFLYIYSQYTKSNIKVVPGSRNNNYTVLDLKEDFFEESQFNWLWNNEITANDLLYTYNKIENNNRDTFYKDGETTITDLKDPSISPSSIQFRVVKEVDDNSVKHIKLVAAGTHSLNDGQIIFPTMKMIETSADGKNYSIIQTGDDEIVPEGYGIPSSTIYDALLGQWALVPDFNTWSGHHGWYYNVPEYEIGMYVIGKQVPTSQIYTGNVYYIHGKTYDIDRIFLSGNDGEAINILFTNDNVECVLIGTTSAGYVGGQVMINRCLPEYDETFTWISPEIQSQYENAYYGYRSTGISTYCFRNDRGVNTIGHIHPVIKAWMFHCYPIYVTNGTIRDPMEYSLLPNLSQYDINRIASAEYVKASYYHFTFDVTNSVVSASDLKWLVKKSDWPVDMDITDVSPMYLDNATYTIQPDLKLIGDQTADVINIEYYNDSILCFTPGEPIDRTHLNPKTLQVNAPCEYDANGNVVSRTPLTFNTYTAQEWANGYHLLGNQWNNMGSPWAYAGNIKAQGSHTMNLVDFGVCPAGRYVNALTFTDQTDTVVEDTLGNSFSTSSQTYYENIGALYQFWDEYVKSNDRHAYPDDGYQNLRYYILQPQETKFIAYHINEATDELTNVELYNDRYTYTHNLTDFADHSLENTVIGTTTSTNESSIPDAYYRTYKGIYLGQSIPLLNIAEIVIDPGMILGVPVYNKQVNTSDTLKYGTVASASLTFRVDIPVDNAMVYDNKLLVAFYDFEHNGVWQPWGFFRIDTIEAQDENCTSIVAHDEVYKLNKYVDDFLKNYTGATTLNTFLKDLLDYCGCEYDPHMATINNGNLNLNNVYNATKTTGLEVAHYIANISPGFVHANMDNDIVLAQYKPTDKVKTVSDYSNLVYNAYNTDMLNKVIITMNNAVIAEDQGSGTKTYYIADNPLLSKHISEAALVLLAEKVLQKYQQIPVYRPAQIKFLTSPGLDIGDVFTVVTKNSQQYNVATMEININEGGLEIKSMGTATYPVDPSSNSQFVNLVDSIDTVQVDVDDLNDAVAGLDGRVGDVEDDIDALDGRIDATESDISGLKTRMTTAEGNITSINGDISSLDSRVDDVEDGLVTVANSLATKILADSISSANDLVTVKINGDTVSNIATKAYVDNSGGLGFTPAAFIAARVSITGNTSINAWYIGRYNADVNLWNGLLLPLEKYAGYSLFQATTNGVLWGLSISDGDWHIITNGSYSVRT